MRPLPAEAFPYDIAYEDGWPVNIDFYGHLNPEQVEDVLWAIEYDPENFGLECGDSYCLSVEHLHRYSDHTSECATVEGESCDCEKNAWFYLNKPTPNSDAVTRFSWNEWGWSNPNCAYHPNRSSTTGLGVQYWPEDGMERATPGPFNKDFTLLYVCEQCSSQLHKRHETLMKCWMDEQQRLNKHGLIQFGKIITQRKTPHAA